MTRMTAMKSGRSFSFRGMAVLLLLSVRLGQAAPLELVMSEISRAPDGSVEHLQFAGSEVGWLASRTGELWRTDDGGISWLKLALPGCLSDSDIMKGVRTAVLWEDRKGFIFACGEAYLTNDGGASWRSFPLPRTSGDGEGVESVLILPDGQTAFAGGSVWRTHDAEAGLAPNWALDRSGGHPSIAVPVIYKTTNAGKSWSQTHLPQGYAVDHFSFLSPLIGFAFAHRDVYRTTNGGDTWSLVDYPRSCVPETFLRREGEPVTLSFIDEHSGWLSWDDGHLLRTGDAGATWCLVTQANQTRRRGLLAMHFFNAEDGIGIGDPGDLVITENGGRDWEVVKTRGLCRTLYFQSHLGWLVTDKAVLRLRITSPGDK